MWDYVGMYDVYDSFVSTITKAIYRRTAEEKLYTECFLKITIVQSRPAGCLVRKMLWIVVGFPSLNSIYFDFLDSSATLLFTSRNCSYQRCTLCIRSLSSPSYVVGFSSSLSCFRAFISTLFCSLVISRSFHITDDGHLIFQNDFYRGYARWTCHSTNVTDSPTNKWRTNISEWLPAKVGFS